MIHHGAGRRTCADTAGRTSVRDDVLARLLALNAERSANNAGAIDRSLNTDKITHIPKDEAFKWQMSNISIGF